MDHYLGRSAAFLGICVGNGWLGLQKDGRHISIISRSAQELIGIGVASVSGWLIFEYLNFFVDDNWIYPGR
jgi:hypothetical protein